MRVISKWHMQAVVAKLKKYFMSGISRGGFTASGVMILKNLRGDIWKAFYSILKSQKHYFTVTKDMHHL